MTWQQEDSMSVSQPEQWWLATELDILRQDPNVVAVGRERSR